MSHVNFSRKIALRYLWSKRSEAFISIITIVSILGVAIGVMVLTIVMAVMTGFEEALKDKIVGADSHIVVRGTSGRIDGWQEVQKTVLSVPGVTSASPFTYHQVLVKSDSHASGLLITGVLDGSAGAEQLSSTIAAPFSIRDLYNPPELTVTDSDGAESEVKVPGILIGRQLARTLQISVRDPVSILSPQLSPTPFGLAPKYRRFVVAGIYSSGLSEYENAIAYVDIREAQRFFGMRDAVTGIQVRITDIDAAPVIARQIMTALGGLGAGYSATDWTASNEALWHAIKLEKRMYFVVLLLIIIMASFSIVTTLVMIVLEKRKDIAVLKTMGASTKQISRIFRFQGAFIGAVGTLLGLFLGFAGCVILQKYGFPLDDRVFPTSQLPIRMEWINFAAVGIAAYVICYFATIYPARRASALEPSDLLRFE